MLVLTKVTSFIKKLITKKASKSDDIATNVESNKFETFFAEFLSKNFSSCLETGSFPEDLKCAKLFPFTRKVIKRINVTKELYVFYPTYKSIRKMHAKAT